MESITTAYGDFIPQHTTDDLRKKEILPVSYHGNGTIKSLPLETETPVQTPAGEVPAELITFHENGTVNRVFPLNGKLSGYWGQEDEAALAKPVTLDTPSGSITCKIISVCFYDTGAMRSVTLWPGESVTVNTPAGRLAARIGLSFTPDGTLHSLEPDAPAPVSTTMGNITAYDPDAVGVNGDRNSLMFGENGTIVSVTTTLTRIKVINPDGRATMYTPEYRESLCGDDETEVVPMTIGFRDDAVTIQQDPDKPSVVIPLDAHLFYAEAHIPQIENTLGALRCSV